MAEGYRGATPITPKLPTTSNQRESRVGIADPGTETPYETGQGDSNFTDTSASDLAGLNSLGDRNSSFTGTTFKPDSNGVQGNGKTITKTFVDNTGATVTVYSDGTYDSTLPSGVNQSAKDIVNGFLKEAGMEELTGEAWKQWGYGTSAAQIMDFIRTTPQYAAKFPAMKTLNSQGRNISEANYIAKEQADRELLKSYGIPSGVYDTHDYLGSLMINNVNQADLQQRLIDAQDTILSKDPSILKYAQDVYGLGIGDLMAGYMDPTLALPVIEQRSKAMKIGGSALQSGFGSELSKNQAEALATQGITQAQALEGFTNIGQMTELGQALPGDESGAVTQQQLIDAQFNSNAASKVALKNVQAKRLATFNESGGLAAGAGGVLGAGSANLAS